MHNGMFILQDLRAATSGANSSSSNFQKKNGRGERVKTSSLSNLDGLEIPSTGFTRAFKVMSSLALSQADY